MNARILCPFCGQGLVHQVRVIANGLRLQVCDECDSTWPAGATLDSSTAEDLSTYLDSQGLPRQSRELDDLNPPLVKTHAQTIQDIQAKKPRRELRGRITAHDGDPAALVWIDAMEYDQILASESAASTSLGAPHVGTPFSVRVWQATIERINDIGDALEFTANSADAILVRFGSLGEYGVARMPLSQFRSNVTPYALADGHYVVFESPDSTSWLKVEIEESGARIHLTGVGNYWHLHGGAADVRND